MKKYDSFILDVDGTLWDSTGIVAQAWQQTIRENGCEDFTVTSEQLKGLFGKTMNVIADCLLPDLDENKRYQIMDDCCESEHRALMENECKICYPNVTDCIRKMAEKNSLFIVSNCQSGYIELFLEKTGLGDCIKDIECYGNTGKNKWDNIRLIVERNQLKNPVYVGDTQGDCDAARLAEVPFIFAEYGFGTADSYVAGIQDFSELMEFMEEDS